MSKQENIELRQKLYAVADNLWRMGEPSEGQDGWYIYFDKRMDELMSIVNAEVTAVLESLEEEAEPYSDDFRYETAVPIKYFQEMKEKYK